MTALFAGGAEKQYRYIMEALTDRYKVNVLLLNQPLSGEGKKTQTYIESHREISFFQLNGNALNDARKGIIYGMLGKIRTLIIQWHWLKNYTKSNELYAAMFTYITQLVMVPLLKKRGIKIVFNERNTGRQICDKKFKVRLLKKCNKVICNSEYASKFIEEKTGLSVAVLKNGIEINPCSRKEHVGFNILVPARISRIKNQMIVIKAFEQLKTILDKDEYSNIQCILAGSCEAENYRIQLKNEIKEHELKIRLVGFVSNMDDLYSMTDLIILPSYEEGTPNVLLEAYMHGIDALISNIPMNRACCTDEDMLFSPNNEMELANKISLCYRTKKTKDFYRKNYIYLIKNYSIDHMKKKYLELFDSL